MEIVGNDGVKLFLGDGIRTFSPLHIFNVLSKYIPRIVLENQDKSGFLADSEEEFDITECVRFLFNEANKDMRRFSSPEELAENLKLYMNFTLCHEVFDIDYCTPYTHQISTYQSLRRKVYMDKRDVFAYVQNMFFELFPSRMKIPLIRKTLVAFLKLHEKTLSEMCEFVCFTDLTTVESAVRSHETLYEGQARETVSFSEEICSDLIEEIFLECERINSIHTEFIVSEIWSVLEETYTPSSAAMICDQVRWIQMKTEALTKVFDERPTIFLPDEKNKKPKVIRLFEDGKRRFAMIDEINGAEKDELKHLFTEDVKNVLAMMTANRDDDIELIKVPIKRAKHCAVPILGPSGLYYKLAIDFFYEFLHELIFGSKVFQLWSLNDMPDIKSLFFTLNGVLDYDEENIFFVPICEFYADFCTLPKLKTSCPHIRDVGSNGFTVQDLKDELVYLGIKNMFPEVESYAEDVHKHIHYEKKSGEVLKTSDMFDAIEHCIQIALFKALPRLAKFVHNQNGCHRLAVKDCCPLARPKPRIKNSMWRTVKLADVEVKKLDLENRYQMSCPDGLKVFPKYEAMTMIIQQLGRSNETSGEVLKKVIAGWKVHNRQFLVDNVDIHQVLTMFDPNSELETGQRLEQAGKIARSLSDFVNCVKNKRLYLRTFSFTPTSREDEKWMFHDEVMEMIPILLEQQGDKVTDKIRKECVRSEIEILDMIRLGDLQKLLEKYKINKDLLTLVPDPENALIIHQLPLAPCLPALPVHGPKGQEIYPKSEAIFQIFQQVICEIAWNPSSFDKNKFAFQNQIWKSLMVCHFAFEYFVPGEWIDETISTLKANKHYIQMKKKKMLTPFIELHDADFGDTISIANIITLTSTNILNGELPAGVKKEDLEKLFVPVWKIRLLLYYHWWDTYVPSCASDDPVATNGIRLCIECGLLDRIPTKPLSSGLNWIDEVVLSKNGEFVEYADALAIEHSATFDLFPSHDWLSNSTWRDRPYINRCEKWTNCENFTNDMDEETVKKSARDRYRQLLSNEREQRNKAIDVVDCMLFVVLEEEEENVEQAKSTEKKKSKGSASDTRKPAPLPPTDKPSTLKVSNEAPRASSSPKPPVPSNQTVKNVSLPQTSEKRETSYSQSVKSASVPPPSNPKSKENPLSQISEKRDTTQPSSSTSNSSNQSKESAVCAKCYRASVLCNEAKSALESAKAEAKKWEKKFQAAEKELKAMKEREKGQKTREEMEKEMKKLKKAMEKLERREIAQAKVRDQLDEENRNVREELREANATHSEASESWALEKSQWELEKEDNDSRMRHLKTVLPSDIRANLDMRLSLDMRRILIDYQNKQDEVLSGVLVRNAEDLVHNLKRLAKDDHETRQRADLEMRRFSRSHQIYQDAVVSGIQKIQADVLITKSELDPLPDEPKLSAQLKELNQQLQVAENAALARQCIVCMVEDSSQPWYCCPICRNGLHLACVETWWNKSGQGTCPHCRYNTD